MVPLAATLIAGSVGRKALIIVVIVLALPIGYLLLDFRRYGGLKSCFAIMSLWPAPGELALATSVAVLWIVDRNFKERSERSNATRSSTEVLDTLFADPASTTITAS